MRAHARQIERNHDLAQALWQTGLHEARLLAVLVDRRQWVSESQMDGWTADFDSWDMCDQACGNLWCRTPNGAGKDPAVGRGTSANSCAGPASPRSPGWRSMTRKRPTAPFSPTCR